MLVKLSGLKLPPDKGEEELRDAVKERLCGAEFSNLKMIKKSLDARDKGDIHYVCTVTVEVRESDYKPGTAGVEPAVEEELPEAPKAGRSAPVVVAGAGPAGLFCALRLIEAGLKVIVFERGRPVEERSIDIDKLESGGILNTESNVLFGEGGAGTYSDGKLTARTRRPESAWFFSRMIQFGAPPSIAYEAKPHIGTDVLSQIVKRIRTHIVDSGSEVHFNSRVDDILLNNGAVCGVRLSSGAEIEAESVVLAAGHSARDVYSMLKRLGVRLEKKGFAAGVRIEHPAELIRDIQYGRSAYRNILPPAEYSLTYRNEKSGRGVYSFCMCPGGRVINSSSENGMLCVNGMSFSDRAGEYSNSAIVVTVHPEDLGDDVLAGIELQREIETEAYNQGGGNYRAPAARVGSFLSGKFGAGLPENTYRPGTAETDMTFLPQWMADELKKALPAFDRKMRGFISSEAVLIGAETRTSSPVRVERNEALESYTVSGLYPAGEGSGYAGGIVSSATDGIRAADVIARRFS